MTYHALTCVDGWCDPSCRHRAPWLLDLFCGAGGATVGYQRAGFRVLGVDITPQPAYPGDAFLRADVLTVGVASLVTLTGAVAIHASPPCQLYSNLAAYQPDTIADRYLDLIPPTRELLTAIRAEYDIPWVIENVPQAPLEDPIMLCGAMFPGVRVYRHRHFETAGFELAPPPHPPHTVRCVRNGYLPTETAPYMSIHGGKHSRAWQVAACSAMGVEWMAGRADTKAGIRDVCEAIPPAYAEFVGRQLLEQLLAEVAA